MHWNICTPKPKLLALDIIEFSNFSNKSVILRDIPRQKCRFASQRPISGYGNGFDSSAKVPYSAPVSMLLKITLLHVRLFSVWQWMMMRSRFPSKVKSLSVKTKGSRKNKTKTNSFGIFLQIWNKNFTYLKRSNFLKDNDNKLGTLIFDYNVYFTTHFNIFIRCGHFISVFFAKKVFWQAYCS